MTFEWLKWNRGAPPTPGGAGGGAGGKKDEIPWELVAQRAYEIWVRKGRPADTQVPDWLAAEAELRAEREEKK